MTGGLFAPLLLSPSSPLQRVPPNYSVDTLSEYFSTVNRGACSPSLRTSGPHSGRGKEEDEELFRDLFTRENEYDADEKHPRRRIPVVSAWTTESTLRPQKPTTRKAQPSTGKSNPRQLPVSMKHEPSQPEITIPLIPRLRLEELVNARPDDDDNNSLSSLRSAALEQVTEEDEITMNGNQSEHRIQCGRKSGNSMDFFGGNQRPTKNQDLENETLHILEKLDLKAVLHTPRPDILSYYPSIPTCPTTTGAKNSRKKPSGIMHIVNPEDDDMEERTQPKETRNDLMKDNDVRVALKGTSKTTRTDGVLSRLAHMESMYGTTPSAPRKTRRETIDRLANPIYGHTSTLQALSSKQREKREAALRSQALMSPVSAAFAVTCRDGTALKKGGPARFLDKLSTNSKMTARLSASSKRKVTKRADSLGHKRRSTSSTDSQTENHGSTINALSSRKPKHLTCISSSSTAARKETLKMTLQNRSGDTNRRAGSIGGSTFITQGDDEAGVDMVEEFMKRSRGAFRDPLTFRSKTSHRTILSLPSNKAGTAKARARSRQVQTPARVARIGGSAFKSRGAHSGRETETFGRACESVNFRQRRVDNYRGGNNVQSGMTTNQRPKRLQAWQVAFESDQNNVDGRNYVGRQSSESHQCSAAAQPCGYKTPPSATTALLRGSASTTSNSSISCSGKKDRSGRHSKRNASSTQTSRKLSDSSRPGFEAQTKVSAQRKRTLVTTPNIAPRRPTRPPVRSNEEGKAPRQKITRSRVPCR